MDIMLLLLIMIIRGSDYYLSGVLEPHTEDNFRANTKNISVEYISSVR